MADPVETSIHFASRYAAMEAALESLGSRSLSMPVLLPAHIPADILSAVIRSGCLPAIMDVSTHSLCITPETVKSFMEDVKDQAPLVVSYLAPGMDPCERLCKHLDEAEVCHILVHAGPSSEVPNCQDFVVQVYGSSVPSLPMGTVSTVFGDLSEAILAVRDSSLGTYSKNSTLVMEELREYFLQVCGDDPTDAFAKAKRVADKVGWEVLSVHPGHGAGTTVFVPEGVMSPAEAFPGEVDRIKKAFTAVYTDASVASRFPEGVPPYPSVDFLASHCFVLPDDLDLLRILETT